LKECYIAYDLPYYKQAKKVTLCKFLDFHSSAVQASIILGCGAALLGDWCPMFRDDTVVSKHPNTIKHQNTNHAVMLHHIVEEWTPQSDTDLHDHKFRF
jgi:uncharacterized protein (DUF697 family)